MVVRPNVKAARLSAWRASGDQTSKWLLVRVDNDPV